MIGAIIGDIVGSIYEFHNHRSKEFEFFNKNCFFTDDSVMTVAVGNALRKSLSEKNDFQNLEKYTIEFMQEYGHLYPHMSYGGRFSGWLLDKNPQPYNSFGNGAAMRVSPIGYFADSIEKAKVLSEKVTKVTHNHPEGIKGAEALCVAMVLARQKKSMAEIKEYITKNYYQVNFTIDEIRKIYWFDETCQGTMPYAFACFFESNDFEDAIRNAISIGGDSDTIAAIVGPLAECYYGIPKKISKKMWSYLDKRMTEDVLAFEFEIKDLIK